MKCVILTLNKMEIVEKVFVSSSWGVVWHMGEWGGGKKNILWKLLLCQPNPFRKREQKGWRVAKVTLF